MCFKLHVKYMRYRCLTFVEKAVHIFISSHHIAFVASEVCLQSRLPFTAYHFGQVHFCVLDQSVCSNTHYVSHSPVAPLQHRCTDPLQASLKPFGNADIVFGDRKRKLNYNLPYCSFTFKGISPSGTITQNTCSN